MKITGFRPAILTADLESMLALFEELGFERSHERANLKEESENAAVDANVCLKNEDGFCIDLNSFEGIPRDVALIRMNVDNFEEGYQFLEEHGFHNKMGEGRIIEAPHLKGALMESPSGLSIMLMQHIKK